MEELVNRGRLFDCATKSVADAVIVVDAEGFVAEMNPMAEQLLGFELDTSKALQIEAVMPLANEETGVKVTPVQDALTQGNQYSGDRVSPAKGSRRRANACGCVSVSHA